MASRFNPSVGILFVQAWQWVEASENSVPMFQSLGRDSVCSSWRDSARSAHSRHVSIPRSGFCLFKQTECPQPEPCCPVSIPRSGFCLFKHCVLGLGSPPEPSFNPSVGILFVQALCIGGLRDEQWRFNPSVGILFVQAAAPRLVPHTHAECFNPSVGILFVQA